MRLHRARAIERRPGAADGPDLSGTDSAAARSAKSPKEPPFGWLPGKEGFKPLKYLFDCARFKINLRLTCQYCRKSVVIDAPGHWWACHKSGKDDHIATFVRRLYCKKCKGVSGEKRRQPKVEQTSEPPDGPLLPGPDEVEWKRFVSGQRR